MKEYIIKGDIAYSLDKDHLATIHNGYLHVKDGKIEDVYKKLPANLNKKTLLDYSGKLIIPGLTDLHAHASQYEYKGTKMDTDLLEWLDKYTFPIEAKFKDEKYAKRAYTNFVNCLKHSFTTRAVIFATLHLEGTYILASLLEKAGIDCYVGLVDMDRAVPDFYKHSIEQASIDNIEYIKRLKDFKHVKPIITPRFAVSTTDEMLGELGRIRKEFGVAAQSHLDENLEEIEYVRQNSKGRDYADVYDRNGLLENSVMAHCIYCNDEELEMLKDRNVYIAHCPEANTNVVTAAICPVRKYLDMGLNVGLGSDVAGGTTLNLFQNLKLAIHLSKLINYGKGTNYKALTVDEAFYIATLGGGRYFGKVGSFMKGYDADIIISDDLKNDPTTMKMSIHDRVERFIYNAHPSCILAKFVKGNKIM